MTVIRKEWARSMLAWGDFDQDKQNMWAIVSWMAAEGGYYNSQGVWIAGALWNPLNTTQDMPGAWDFNWVHVKNYQTQKDGLNATIKTINQKDAELGYNPIRKALEADGEAGWALNTLRAVEKSQWGTGGLALRVLPWVKHYWGDPRPGKDYSVRPIGQ